jgi:mono/diheme cytochrome c family protein
MKNVVSLLALVAFVGAIVVSLSDSANARPQYHKAFAEKYAKVADQANEIKCGVCHGDGGKNKKQISDYGKALAEALAMKNQKDVDAINKGLDTVAAKECGDGKTFGDLLNDGKLPPPHKAAD